MTFTLAWGGSVNSTSGNTSYPNNFVWSGTGVAFPSGNFDTNGVRRVRVYGISAGYASGASGVFNRLNVGGTLTDGFATLFDPASTFTHELHYASGTLSFGRNTGAGGVVTNAADGFTWGGMLVGSLQWATVSTAPAAPTLTSQPGGALVVSFANAASDGGAPAQSFTVQVASNPAFSGAVSAVVTASPYTLTGLNPGGTYYARVAQNNEVGSSAWSGVSSALLLSGGKVRSGAAWKAARMRVRVSGAWRDAVVKVRSGGTWHNAQ